MKADKEIVLWDKNSPCYINQSAFGLLICIVQCAWLQRHNEGLIKPPNHQPLVIGNPSDTINTADGVVTLYIPEFSRPTGKYINKLLLRILNRFVRSGSIAIAGNPCTPGLGLMDELTKNGATDMLKKSPQRTIVVNCKKHAEDLDAVVFKAEPFMRLMVREEWSSLSDCIAAMHSKYRVRAKKALTESGVLQSNIYRGLEIPASMFGQMAELLSQTLAKKTIALPSDLNRLLRSFANQFGNQFEVQVYEFENRTVGFLSRIYLPSGVYGMHIGYSSIHAKQWHIYQRMMLDLMDAGITSGAKSINLGRTATEIKSTLGAEPQENYFVLLSRNRFIRAAARTYKNLFFKPADYIIRHPFKG